MYSAQTNAYFENSINTASPSQLLIMLCDGAIKHCRQGVEAIKRKDIEKANDHLCRTQDIIQEFIATLDKEAEIAQQLLALYDYFLRRLREANIRKEAGPAEEVLDYLKELKSTWAEAALKVKQSQTGTVSQYG